MMRFYVPIGVEDAELCLLSLVGNKVARLINGQILAAEWRPIEARIVHKDENGIELSRSDSPWYASDALVFRQTATEALRSILLRGGELLPLRCNEAPLFIYNPTRILEGAFNEGASDVMRDSQGKLFHVRQYALHNEIIDVDIFKIPDVKVSPTFVSERFVEQWHAAGLVGLEFRPCL